MEPYEIEAEDLGETAFKAGIGCAPALDEAVMALIKRKNPEGTIGAPSTTKIFDAWLRAWTRANLSH